MNSRENILVIGAAGQIGTDLVLRLRNELSADQVIATDVKDIPASELRDSGPFKILDVLDFNAVANIVESNNITQVYLLAALLSATAEQNPKLAWKLNMEGLFNLLDIAKEKRSLKIFWPSSIAVFGPTTPRVNTPQYTVMEPVTVYGVSKQAGERWCEYYHQKFNVDVRSIRYPGLISYKSPPGGGTTDYAVDIFHKAINDGKYECFLKADTMLPMMYMPDALDATLQIMDAPAASIKIRSSYNISAISFTPEMLAAEIRKHLPSFEMIVNPDFRQAIAESWPDSIDDSMARKHWNWKESFGIESMTKDMLTHIRERYFHNTEL